MTVVVRNCYLTNGQPATADNANSIIYPVLPEGVQQPTPAKAAANVVAAIAALLLTPQPSLK